MSVAFRFFASDNASGVHPEVLEAIGRANVGHALAYGADPYTESAIARFRAELGPEVEVLFAFGGTGANVAALGSVLRPFESVLCAQSAHLWLDEGAAPERFLGSKLVPVTSSHGKVTIPALEARLARTKGVHHAQPRVVSISQATELGVVYAPEEIRELSHFAHEKGMLLHMDGARISNAAAFLECALRDITADAGVDLLSFGGTKNGILGGEAIVFFDRALFADAPFVHKQSMQLASKTRFIAVQFEALLTDDLWRRNAAHANAMARRLANAVKHLPHVEIVAPVQTNAVFARVPLERIGAMQEHALFHVWDERVPIVRWMTSFDTTEDDVDTFADHVIRIST
ncbi:MAG: low specificity L-threonine aldolase [Myxococcales bacterium]